MDNLSNADGSRRLAINAEWFTKLRWVAAVGQLATIAVVIGPLGVAAPAEPLVVLVGVTLVSNAIFSWWTRTRRDIARPGEWHAILGALMLLDLIVLTAMLALTGGPTNPFVVFYFVNLALSGVVLSTRWAWVLCVLAIGAFALLTYSHNPVPVLQDTDRLMSVVSLRGGAPSEVPLATMGAWVAFAVCASVIVNFTTRLTGELETSNLMRRKAEEQQARAEKLEALGTLAAGAAHELATPLSTIAIASSEAQRELERAGGSEELIADLALVRRETDRCRTILDRMASDSGQPAAGIPERLSGDALIDEVLADLATADRVDTEWVDGADRLMIVAPRTALAQAVRGVVQNAIDATNDLDPDGRVTIHGDRLAGTLRLAIQDRGPGMPAEVLSRASEPFYTTKAPGSGMGLGLFLARSVIERLGGSLRLESPEEGGAIVTIVLPLDGSD